VASPLRHAHTDTNGRHPTVGDTVIANVSGTLRKGIVVGVGRGRRSNPEVGYGAIKVELIDSQRAYWNGHVSKIKNADGVFVIRPGDAPPSLDMEFE
jgi:hypothetical protein